MTLAIPKQIQDYYECKLLHPKTSTWDGETYRWDPVWKEWVPDLKTICAQCNNTNK